MESSESPPSYSNFVDPVTPKPVFLMQQTPQSQIASWNVYCVRYWVQISVRKPVILFAWCSYVLPEKSNNSMGQSSSIISAPIPEFA